MALYEYICEACTHRFEQITSSTDPDAGKCPNCQRNDRSRRLISRFAVGGRGDLRESTMHGCHGGCNHHHHISPVSSSSATSESAAPAAEAPTPAPSSSESV